MSITAVNLADGIRVDQATQKGSINDVVALVTGKKGSYAIQVFSRIKGQNNGLIPKCDRLKINDMGNETLVAGAATLVCSFVYKKRSLWIRTSRPHFDPQNQT